MKSYGGSYMESAELRALGLRAGSNVRVHSTCVLVGLDNIVIGDNVRVDPFCSLIAVAGHISIGNHVHLATSVFLSASEGIDLGDFANLSRSVSVFTRSDDSSGASLTDPTVPEKYLGQRRAPVRIGRHCIVGAGSVVLPGVDISE